MQETKKEEEEKFSIVNHPWIMLMCAIYHSEKKGREPDINDIHNLLRPLITLDGLKPVLKDALEWSTIGRKIVKRYGSHVSAYYCISNSSREIYEKYWLKIEMEKREAICRGY